MPTFSIDYKGNTFVLEKKDLPGYPSAFSIQSIVAKTQVVEVPGTYEGLPISRLPFSFQNPSLITSLRIPKEISIILSPGGTTPLPSLVHLWVAPENPHFATDGRCLLSKDRRKVYKYLCQGDGSPLSLEATVEKINAHAFQGSPMTSIQFPDQDIEVGQDAFQDSAWLQAQREQAVVGGRLYRLKAPIERLDLSGEVRGIYRGAFRDYLPGSILCNKLPFDLALEVDDERVPDGHSYFYPPPEHPIPIGRFRELLLTSHASLPIPKYLHLYPTLENIVVQEGHPMYRTEDGILYSADGKRLLYCPPQKPLQEFSVPEGVESIESRAFLGQSHLRKLYIPDTVTAIGSAAFTKCKKLQEVRLSDRLLQLPDYGGIGGAGVFEDCYKLSHVVFGRNLLFIGSYAFNDCPLVNPVLPDSLLQIGERALEDAKGETTLSPQALYVGKYALYSLSGIHVSEGTAKGLFEAILPENFILYIRPKGVEGETPLPERRLAIPDGLSNQDRFNFFSYIVKSFSSAWDNDVLYKEELCDITRKLSDSPKKAKYILAIQEAFPGDPDFSSLQKTLAEKIVSACEICAKRDNLADFLYLLEKRPLSLAETEELLERLNKLEKPTFIAYLLSLREGHADLEKETFPL